MGTKKKRRVKVRRWVRVKRKNRVWVGAVCLPPPPAPRVRRRLNLPKPPSPPPLHRRRLRAPPPPPPPPPPPLHRCRPVHPRTSKRKRPLPPPPPQKTPARPSNAWVSEPLVTRFILQFGVVVCVAVVESCWSKCCAIFFSWSWG